VQAPAGSGKTELLTQRFLKLLGQVSRPERVLAVTFTRKAAAEMRQRVMARMQQASGSDSAAIESHQEIAIELAGRVLEQDRELGWNLVQNPNRMRISTIDSFCADLASRQPLLAGNSWHLAVTDHAKPLYRAAAKNMLLDPDGGQEHAAAMERVLVFMEGRADNLCELLAGMLGNRDQWASPDTISETDLSGFAASLADVQQQMLNSLIAAAGADALREAGHWLACIGGSDAEKTDPSAIRVRELLEQDSAEDDLLLAHFVCKALLTTGNKLRTARGVASRFGFSDDSDDRVVAAAGLRALLEDWGQKPGVIDVVERIGRNIPVMPGPEGMQLLEDLKLLLRMCLAYLNVEFEEQGRCDFLSVSEAASNALGSADQPSDVLLAEDNRISHILMDEFQDTSRAQFSFLDKLIAGWEPGDGRSLFLVGDPMQSIYGFREAEVGLFIKICETGQLGPVTLNKLTLQNNFRSNEEVLEWVNEQFPRIFPATENATLGAVSYTRFLPHRGAGGSVQVHLSGPERDEFAEADDIAQLIKLSVQKNPDETIAVLARTKRVLTPIAHALLRLGVDFEAVDADPLEFRPVVLDLLSLCRALSHPLDRVAWISLLRAPWCGLNLSEIHSLLGEDASVPVLESLEEDYIAKMLEGESARRVQRLAEVIGHAYSLRGVQPLSQRLEVCWLRLGGPEALLGAAELASAQLFIECLRNVELEQVDDVISELRQRLEILYATKNCLSNVQLMSIHKAKDRVIIPRADKGSGGGFDPPLVRWQRYPEGQVLIAPRNARKFEGNSLYQYLQREQATREQYETQRVLYVAVTRAKKQLDIFGRYAIGKKGINVPVSGSFLRLLWPGLEADVEHPEIEITTTEPVTPLYPLLRLKSLPDDPLEPADSALHDLWLEIAHNNSQERFSTDWLDSRSAAMAATLRAFGAEASSQEQLQAELRQGLECALCTQTGREIVFGPESAHTAAELGIRVRNESSLQKYVIDRLDVDSSAFTITDYKTGSASDDQQQKWAEQLARYAELVGLLGVDTESSLRVYHPQDQTVHNFNHQS
jgi:ATP-dependent exoDNAse (exonuclease V) beta subunit